MSKLVRKKLYGQFDGVVVPVQGASPVVSPGMVLPQWQFSIIMGLPVALSNSAHHVRFMNCPHPSSLTPSKPYAATAAALPFMCFSMLSGVLNILSAQSQLFMYQP